MTSEPNPPIGPPPPSTWAPPPAPHPPGAPLPPWLPPPPTDSHANPASAPGPGAGADTVTTDARAPWAAGPSDGWATRAATPPVGPPRPRRIERPPADRAPAHLLAWTVAGGVALEVGLRGGLTNAVVVAGLACLIGALVTGGRLQQRSSRRLALAALLPVAFLAWRASPWLAASNVAAATALLAAAILFDRHGSWMDTGLGDITRRFMSTIPAAATAPLVLAPLVPRSATGRARAVAVGRAAAVAVPVLGVVVVLLASADAVFAGIVHPNIHLGTGVGHVLAALAAMAALLGVVAMASAEPGRPVRAGSFGALEVVTMLALAAGVLGLFVASQVVALTGAGHRLVTESGITPAEHARSGFFQLCWATAILLAFLGLVDRLSAPGVRSRRAVRALGAAVPLLALGLVAVSLQRMARYDHAFGLTMLRLWVVGAAVWFGVVLVLVALRNVGVRADKRWVLSVAAAAAVVLVLVADAADPEAFVVRHDVARAADGAPLDGAYLRDLSADAAPAVAAALDRVTDPGIVTELQRASRCTDPAPGVGRLNAAVQRADRLRHRLCDATASPPPRRAR